ncbi:hypothetical protein F5Y12DRAFT_791902 [Xylaria sp. FL1777]|nr:hypothetical protein F5Y12DRAFT_791902 [Xylaria sp. FL1777]
MLRVSADPRCEKSILAKYLVDSKPPTTESRIIPYYFFEDDFADQRSARGALCYILHQLSEQKGILLISKIIEMFEARNDNLTSSFIELRGVLISASRDKDASEIIRVPDAFDDFVDQGHSDLTRYLRKLCSTRNRFSFKFS